MALYNTIGVGYNTTRNADPHLADRIFEMLEPSPDGVYLDIGCGTGNYLKALTEKGLNFYGIDPSEVMLNEARKNCDNATLIQASSESIPVHDAFFDGAIAILTTHHWSDLQKGLKELNRVLKPGAKAVFFTFSPEQMMGYWLHHYFPEMIEKSRLVAPPVNDMMDYILKSGFTTVEQEIFFIHEGIQDHFLYSNKFNPAMYLQPEIRMGTSAFRNFITQEKLDHGLIQLEADIHSGAIHDVMKKYENDMGDYLFLIATKSH